MNDTLLNATDLISEFLLFGTIFAAVLVTAAWGIIRLGRIKAPVHRHMIWLMTLTMIVVIPVLWNYGPKLSLSVLPAVPIQNHIMEASTPQANFYQAAPLVYDDNVWEILKDINIFAYLWCAGFVFLLTRLLIGRYRLSRIMNSSTPVSDDMLPKGVLNKKIKVVLTGEVESPVCFGLFQPIILLPEHVYTNSSRDELNMVVYHERAHIERKDCWINLFQRILEAVFFYHPMVWYASLQLTNQREQICDNHVIAEGVIPKNYVQLLTRIVEQGLEKKCFHAVALFEGKLLARARELLKISNNKQIKVSRRVKFGAVLVIAICLAISTIRLEAKTDGKDTQAGIKNKKAHEKIKAFENNNSKELDLLLSNSIKETSLKIELLGTVSKEKEHYAVIWEAEKKKPQIYRVGDTIQGAVLTKIYRGMVFLKLGEQYELLKPSYPIQEISVNSNPMQGQPFKTKTIKINRSDVSKSLADLQNLMTQARIQPHFTNGVPDGLACTGIKAGSIFRKMGLRNGDILKNINGNPLNSPESLIGLYNKINSASDCSLQIIRRGKEWVLNIEFSEQDIQIKKISNRE